MTTVPAKRKSPPRRHRSRFGRAGGWSIVTAARDGRRYQDSGWALVPGRIDLLESGVRPAVAGAN